VDGHLRCRLLAAGVVVAHVCWCPSLAGAFVLGSRHNNHRGEDSACLGLAAATKKERECTHIHTLAHPVLKHTRGPSPSAQRASTSTISSRFDTMGLDQQLGDKLPIGFWTLADASRRRARPIVALGFTFVIGPIATAWFFGTDVLATSNPRALVLRVALWSTLGFVSAVCALAFASLVRANRGPRFPNGLSTSGYLALKRTTFDVDRATPSEVEWALVRVREQLDLNDAEIDRIRARIAVWPHSVTVAKRRDSGAIIGFTILYLLGDQATQRVLNGLVYAGANLDLSDQVGRLPRARSIYVAMVYGVAQTRARAFTVSMLEQQIARLALDNPKVSHVFTRPHTGDGRRLARLRVPNMKPVAEGRSKISMLDADELRALWVRGPD